MYDYIVLDSLNASTYKHLTYFWLQERLDRLSPQDLTNIALGVALQGQPVGLVLAECPKNQHQANILSLFVAQKHRQQGIGTALLMQIEEILKQSGCQQLNILYNLNLTTPILERMLKQQNWEPASFYSLQCLTKEIIKQAPFLHRYTFPQRFTIFPWVELSDRERLKIKQRDNGLNYPDELCPFREDRIAAISSIGLRNDREEVIGWSIVQQSMPNLVVYRALFIKPEFQGTGLGIHLLAASINRQITDEKVTEALFIILAENKKMVRFVNRHLAPYLTSINSFWKSSKLMAASTAIEQNLALFHST